MLRRFYIPIEKRLYFLLFQCLEEVIFKKYPPLALLYQYYHQIFNQIYNSQGDIRKYRMEPKC
jgi:uncharacterized pyridoxamine 5'-phosphate oxidase family protein